MQYFFSANIRGNNEYFVSNGDNCRSIINVYFYHQKVHPVSHRPNPLNINRLGDNLETYAQCVDSERIRGWSEDGYSRIPLLSGNPKRRAIRHKIRRLDSKMGYSDVT